jgi:hypothetical protein
MPLPFVLLPLFVEVVLTFGLLIWLAFLRRDDMTSGGVKGEDIALREPNWPRKTLQVGYAYSNQFELPVLFYVLTILAIITRHADLLFVILSWIFVLARLVHAFEHTTRNMPMRRGGLFGIGMVVLLVMWLIFIVRILLGLP